MPSFRIPRLIACLLLLITLSFAAGAATPPGAAPAKPRRSTLVGTVVDKDGPLPGATVELTGNDTPSIPVLADADGRYRFESVSPGVYVIRASPDGATWFSTDPITVTAGNDVQVPPLAVIIVEVEVKSTMEKSIEQNTTAQGQSFAAQKLTEIPVARASVDDVVKIAAGVSSEGDSTSGGLSVYGATSLESSYVIDGINTTSVDTGRMAKKVNFDIIDKIDIKTAGYEAEFGGAQGAVVDVQTKSGGNEFLGAISYYGAPPSAASDPQKNAYGTSEAKPDSWEASGSLGGYFVRDKLLFFTSVSRRSNLSSVEQRSLDLLFGGAGRVGRDLAESTDRQDQLFLKSTWVIDQKSRLVGTILADPREQILRDDLSGPGGDHQVHTGGKDLSLLYNWFPNSKVFVEAQVGRHAERTNTELVQEQSNLYDPVAGDRRSSTPSIRFRPDAAGSDATAGAEVGYKTGPYPYTGLSEGSRDSVRLAVQYALTHHALKAGLGLERGSFDTALNYGYGSGMALEWSEINRTPTAQTANYDYIVGVRRCWGTGDGDCRGWDDQVRTQGTPETLAGFVQDRWQPWDNLTVNAGLRWESQSVKGPNGGTALKIDNNLAPRFGMTWDPTKEGRAKIYGSYGRYYDIVPLQAVNRAFAPRVVSTRMYRIRGKSDTWTALNFLASTNWNAASSDGGICPANDPVNQTLGCWDFESGPNDPTVRSARFAGDEGGTMTPEVVYSSGSNYDAPVVRNLEGAHSDEWTAGFEWRLWSVWTVGLKAINRELKKAIEDMSLDNGRNFIIANPGGPYTITLDNAANPGLMDPSSITYKMVESGKCAWGGSCTITDDDLRANGFGTFPRATRHFRGYEATVGARFSEKLWFTLSYLHSKTEGNYRGRYVTDTEERDPNATEAFDVPGLAVNTEGLLPQDRTHQLKVLGNWRVIPALGIGATLRYASGTPYSATTDPTGGSTPLFGAVYLLPRGTAGRTPSTTNLDLSFAYDMKTDGKLKLTAFVDVFNALDEQKAVAVDEQFLKTGLWTLRSYNGNGEPLDAYVKSAYGVAGVDNPRDASKLPSLEAWNNWAVDFGRLGFGSVEELYEYLVTTTASVNGRVQAAYPGFAACKGADGSIKPLQEAISSGCGGRFPINPTYGQAKRLEVPRSIRFGVRLTF